MQTIAEVLTEAPFLHGLAPEYVELVAGCARNVHFDAGSILFREGEPADTFYVLRSGSVAIETYAAGRGSLAIETIDAGDVIGWSWLFPPHRWHFDGRALSAVRATAFDGACLRGKCEADPALGFELTKRMAQVMIERLKWTRIRLLDVYGG
jgi:CRP-like cAMP-binding protein